VPALGRNAARQPHWAAYNLLFHSALPPFEGRKAYTRELPAQVPAARPPLHLHKLLQAPPRLCCLCSRTYVTVYGNRG
jgi:hypothetical protein